ncbi:MAG: TonB-dependent receptor [Chitinophagales bacterium]|nr:TonB-dependent receptor [Chitinophagales bacterium]
MEIKSHLTIGFLFFFQAVEWFSANAQDSILVHAIPGVIISATRTPKGIDSIGRSVTLISSQEIKSSANDLAQLLSNYAGISVIGAGQNPGMTESIFMRGANSNQTLILIDGIRISDPSSVNNAIDLAELSVSGLQQIEIVRGSHSTLFGSAGIGGVINLISATPVKTGFHGEVRVKAGTFGKKTFLLDENLALNYSSKKGLYGSAEFFNKNVNGLDATADTVSRINAFKRFDRDNFGLTKANAKLGFTDKKWNVSGTYSYTDERTDFDKKGFKYNDPYGVNPDAWYDGDSTRIFTTRHLSTYKAAYRIDPHWHLQLNGGISVIDRHTIDDSSIVNYNGVFDHTISSGFYRGTSLSNDMQVTWNQKNITVSAGAGGMRERMTFLTDYFTNGIFGPYESVVNVDSIHPHAFIYNAFVQSDFSGELITRSLSSLHIIAGIRWNHHDLFGDKWMYEINPSYCIKANTLVYLSWSTGFNAPSLYQLYAPDFYYISDISRGNPSLKPETSQSIEAGYKQKIGNTFSLALSGYRSVVDNEIEYVYLWDKDIPVNLLGTDFSRDDYRGDTYINIGTQTNYGAELSFSYKPVAKIKVDGTISVVKGKLTYRASSIDTMHTESNHVQLYSNGAFPSSEITTNGLIRRPNTANLKTTWFPLQKFFAQLSAYWSGRQKDIYYDSNLGPFGALGSIPVKGYVLFDGLFNYEFSEHFGSSLKIENILNTHYTEINGFTTKGRAVYLTLKGSF